MSKLGFRGLGVVAVLWAAAMTGCGPAEPAATEPAPVSASQELNQCDPSRGVGCRIVGQVCYNYLCVTPCDPAAPLCPVGKQCCAQPDGFAYCASSC